MKLLTKELSNEENISYRELLEVWSFGRTYAVIKPDYNSIYIPVMVKPGVYMIVSPNDLNRYTDTTFNKEELFMYILEESFLNFYLCDSKDEYIQAILSFFTQALVC